MTRDQFLAEAGDPSLRKIIDNLYRPGATVGAGGTADAVKEEIRAGKRAGGHIEKAQNYRVGLQNYLARPNVSARDRVIAEQLLADLVDALSHLPQMP